jgi:alpha-tubulin suppressor-like RCC1 family protein
VPANVPVGVQKLADASAIAAGPDHTCALQRSGKAVCWGRNDQGQLGSGTSSNVWTSRVPIIDIADVLALDVGWGHSCAALPGRLACWGDNAAGQAGIDGSSAATPRPGISGLDVAALALGRDHSCARLRSGEVACWGSNERGQLGDGGRSVAPRPVDVLGL